MRALRPERGVGGPCARSCPLRQTSVCCLDIHGARSAATRLHPQLLHDHPRNTTITSARQEPNDHHPDQRVTLAVVVVPMGRSQAFQVHTCARAILVGHIEMENAWTLGDVQHATELSAASSAGLLAFLEPGS